MILKLFMLSFLIIFCIAAFSGSELRLSDEELNETRDILNFTDSSLNQSQVVIQIISGLDNKENSTSTFGLRMRRLISYGVEWGVSSSFEIAGWGVEFGYKNPDSMYYSNFLNFLKLVIVLYLILCFLPFIVPVFALMIILWMFIKKVYRKVKRGKKK